MGNDMKKSNTVKEILKILFTAAVLAFLLMKFILIPCVVEGSSMNPILQSNDFGYSFVVTRNLGIERFDIAVISLDGDRDSKLLVKRVIGLPGDEIRFSEGNVYRNGEALKEPYLMRQNASFSDIPAFAVPDGAVFVLGDNRENSKDSRFMVEPYVPIENIYAEELFQVPVFIGISLA